MDPVMLARLQFAFTIGFHFIFAPLSIGLAWLIFCLVHRYVRRGDPLYRQLARFWIRILALMFAVGAATGITMEFQFGTNWAAYSKFVGDIFGAPLAAEVVFAFFLESSFLAVLVFGWNRVSRRALWVAALMVAVGATLSAFWILVANSWQQTPAGYELVAGRAVLTDFWAAVFNPSTLPRFLHTVTAALASGAFFMLGISAYYLLKKRHEETARRALRLALIVAALASFAVLGAGHYSGMQVAATQPIKLAAIEGLFHTQSGAPVVFGIIDGYGQHVDFPLIFPKMLSFLAYGDFQAEVMGLDRVPLEDRPPVALTFYTFHFMVLLGMWLIGLTVFGLVLLRRGRLYDHRRFLWAALLTTPLPLAANELGWITAEVGRQPWAVYNVLRTSDAVSANIPGSHVLTSFIIFMLIYAVIFVLWLTVLRRLVRRGPGDEDGRPSPEGAA